MLRIPLPQEYWLSQTWGHLQLDPNQMNLPEAWPKSTKIKFWFKCACGRITCKSMQVVTSGNTTSCGKCTYLSKSFWLLQKWGNLRLDSTQSLPDEFPPNGNSPTQFRCDCGGNTTSTMCKVTSGHTRSCGKCHHKTREFWLQQKWGALRLDPNNPLPESWSPSSTIKSKFICDCSNTPCIEFRRVMTGNNTTCGQCSFRTKDEWLSETWGTLHLDPDQLLPNKWGITSVLKLKFICDCGRSTVRNFGHLTATASCERCNYRSRETWLSQKWGTLKISPTQTLPEEWGAGYGKIEVTCDCGKRHTTAMSNLIYNYTKSCGCQKTGEGESSPENSIRTFVASLAPDTLPSSYSFSSETRRQVDVYVPSLRLAIEHHGLPWHSERFHKNKDDYAKFIETRELGIRLIQIYSDEWRDKQEIIKAMLRDLIKPGKKIRIKPVFSVELKTSPEVRYFLDQNHYLGAASGCLTIVARHHSVVVGAWVFMKRETGTILWHRACWDRAYKSWNPHEKALSLAKPILKDMGFTRVLTFSDNRFHTGKLYETLGFTFEGEIKPDYGYTKNGNCRVSKYALRVPAGVNEVGQARAKGWYRIWDSGKRRYSLLIK